MRPNIAENWKLHSDSAPSHTCFVVNYYLVRNRNAMLLQLPYSLNLVQPDIFLFPCVKAALKEHRHGTIKEAKVDSMRCLKVVPENDFQGAFQKCTLTEEC